ncbi:zinc finger and BTB domain-containing protein 25 [Corythoichthys intestinalis]|uniref:zinc finger and BTB domain-containing protein 25 n=1 Tax=Corythoichthys intestinalis TaxID=161448 RepID=UPI0025A5490C|nr:zinc finger and BTB domain-containing protein 25 [Corythoichthys intestinalis]XP_061806345.1 zinc finger and BTB domain-containing protein 25-like [Nerophis lumbriciformis]
MEAPSVPVPSAHSLVLLQQLNVQREFGFLCDCTVAIGNVYFKAHRAVLAAFSNYFKMIFIHQTSECIKIQPTDIQPDVFSYLLHVMYTGACPKQPVEPARLEDGIKFLHAHQLCRKSAEGPGAGADVPIADSVRTSNLYGIQISSQLAGKEAPAGGESRGARARSQPSLAPGSEGERSDGRASSPRDDFDISSAIKQERPDDEGPGSPPHVDDAACKERPPPLACPRCGHRCASPERLRQHLFSHALRPALFAEVPPNEEGGGFEDERLDAGRLEEALRQSRALAAQLAAELRRSRAGAEAPGSATPAAGHSRKRKMACAVCGVRFSHKSQLQEHMYAHTAKPPRLHRHSQLFHSSAHFCPEGGGAPAEDAFPDARDNGSSAYSLDSEISQESGDGGRGE